MKSKVYFVPAQNADALRDVNIGLERLLVESKIFDFIRKESRVGVKVHFGEEGNTGYVRPEHLRVICDEIKKQNAVPLLSDTNTLYRGKRLNSKDHLALAYQHGFTREITGADVYIPDENHKEDLTEIQLDRPFIKTAKVARFFMDVDALVAVTHFKGHILTGFGGALKNIGMGCATREGKLAQHCDVSPVVYNDQCIGCGECEVVCPVQAIQIKNGKSVIDSSKCIGCASCIAACPHMAMFIDMEEGDRLQMKMAEYSLAVLQNRKDRAAFINFAIRINQECDCWSLENPRIAPDVGILASLDPVSIDKASYDLVNDACGKNIFEACHPKQDGLKHLKYAEELGLGSMEYDLVRIG